MVNRFMRTAELREILFNIYKIPPEQCKLLGLLFCATQLDSMPRIDTIALSGQWTIKCDPSAAVHCYMYSKYMIKQFKQVSSPQDQ